MAEDTYPRESPHRQLHQPAGVPPLELTGERTLPDVPAENYWFKRHLVVYEWISERCAGLRVIDMACGEGYGAEVLARRAARVTGVDANPEAHEHARLRYTRPGLRFRRALVEEYAEPCDTIVFLQTIEHLSEPERVLEHFRRLLPANGVLYVTTPNVRTLAPTGAERSDNPWHMREYDAACFRTLCAGSFARVEVLGVFHARRLRLHEAALTLGWDGLHQRLGLTRPFYDRFVPAIGARDFAVRPTEGRRLEHALDFLAVVS